MAIDLSLPLPPPRVVILFVALASSILVPGALASASSTTTRDLIDWIVSEGGVYNSKQAEQTFADGKMRGIFATEDIAQGELLLKVPWNAILGATEATTRVFEKENWEREAEIYEAERFMAPVCRVIKAVYQEVQKKEQSYFAPYLDYLSLLPNSNHDSALPPIPAMWSEEARDLLEDIDDHGRMSPGLRSGLFTTMTVDWFGECVEDIQNDTLEKNVAGTVASHGSMGAFGLLVPLLDNHYYNQVAADFNNVANVSLRVVPGKFVSLRATTKIPKGSEILRSTGDTRDKGLSTIEAFIESGILDEVYYPKIYDFGVQSSFTVRIAVDHDGDGNFFALARAKPAEEEEEDEEDDEEDDEEREEGEVSVEEVVEFLTYHIHRLLRIKSVVLDATEGTSNQEPPEGSIISRAEWTTIWMYHSNLLQALELALQTFREDFEGEDLCPGGNSLPSLNGSCPIWDGFEALPDNEPKTLDLYFNEDNPYGPSKAAYDYCNDISNSWEGYRAPGGKATIMSHYQSIRFASSPSGDNVLLTIDSTNQQCSWYRPHYHEMAVHFPARFLERIENVLFVGGGDSMILHEILKYPSLEKVVGLELDQFVTRNSFRYFETQPHFDDKRVEWWFGDCAKSLLMLPKDYFQHFDLVVVDLSETVMSLQVTDQLSIFQTLSLLLKPDGILQKNGNGYMDSMSEYFDYTLQFVETDVPYICDQVMVLGSNKIDFFNHTLKDHGVELLVLESQEEINEKFGEYYRFSEYRRNDAHKQGQCEDVNHEGTESENAGIFMAIEAENVKHELKSFQAIERTISDSLTAVGFSIESTVKHEPSTIIIVSKEGYVVLRLHPEKSYVGLDIKLWANFHLLEAARDALIQSLGGSEEGTSSFRVMTGGMSGSPFKEVDRLKTGPRIVNNRNCDHISSPASDGKRIVDLKKSGLESSLELVEDDVVAAVLCGSVTEECKSFEILNEAPPSKFRTVLPIYTCPSMNSKDADLSQFLQQNMAKCEVDLSNALSRAEDNISLLVLDESSNRMMGKVLLSIFSSVWNRKKLFSQHRFIALAENNSDAWRRNLLALIREKIAFQPLSLADLVLENSEEESKLSLLSMYDERFFFHLKEMIRTFNEDNGEAANMAVDNIFDGLEKPKIGHFKPKLFKHNDYDIVPAQEQYAGQMSLGRQSLIQFEMNKINPVVSISMVESALKAAIVSKGEVEFTSFENNPQIGDGLVVVAFSADGTTQVILSWDGKTKIDINLYSADENPVLRKQFINSFTREFGRNIKPTQSDTHPRGIGRVVNFPGSIN